MEAKNLAGILGPAVMAVAATEALNMPIFAAISPTVVYLNGTLLFVAGLALLRAYHAWTFDWRVILTIVAWFALALGLYRMVLPNAPQAGDTIGTYVGLGLLFTLGAVLSFNAFKPAAPSSDGSRRVAR